MCDAAGAEAWSYDPIGRALTDRRTTSSITKDTIYGYNLDGSLATLTYPGGRVITYQPGGAGRPLWAKDVANSINYVTGTCGPTSDGVCYAPQGAPASLQNGASIVSTLYYNSRLQPCRISVKSSGTAPTQCSDTTNIGNVLDFSYNFSVGTADNGNVVSIANNRDTNRMQNFTYDSMNRIATAYTSGNLWGETFQIDQWGNLNKILAYAGKPQPENLNQMAGNNNRFVGMSYDAAGNLLNDGASTYLYDAENRIQTGAGVTYTYDGDGKRVQKSNGKLYWYGTGSDPLDESDASGNLTDEYVFFGGKRIARRNVSSGNIFYYFADHLGTSRVILQAGQTIPCYDADFYPFGGERIVTNTCPQNYKFTGKERESGLDNFAARYFGSTMGRFMSPDPPLLDQHIADPQSWNLYSYARNNPLSYIDPTGNAVELLGDEEERKKELEFLKKSLGNDKAASNLYINEVKDGDKTRYFVGIKGDVGEFMKMGDTSHDLANLVQNKNVVEFGLTSQDLSRQGGAATYEKGEVGNQNVRVLVNPDPSLRRQ